MLDKLKDVVEEVSAIKRKLSEGSAQVQTTEETVKSIVHQFKEISDRTMNLVVGGGPGTEKSRWINRVVYPEGNGELPLHSADSREHQTRGVQVVRHEPEDLVLSFKPLPVRVRDAFLTVLRSSGGEEASNIRLLKALHSTRDKLQALDLIAAKEDKAPEQADSQVPPGHVSVRAVLVALGQWEAYEHQVRSSESEPEQVRMLSRLLGKEPALAAVGLLYELHIGAPWIKLSSDVRLWDTPGLGAGAFLPAIVHSWRQADVLIPKYKTRSITCTLLNSMLGDIAVERLSSPPVIWDPSTDNSTKLKEELWKMHRTPDQVQAVRFRADRDALFQHLASTVHVGPVPPPRSREGWAAVAADLRRRVMLRTARRTLHRCCEFLFDVNAKFRGAVTLGQVCGGLSCCSVCFFSRGGGVIGCVCDAWSWQEHDRRLLFSSPTHSSTRSPFSLLHSLSPYAACRMM